MRTRPRSDHAEIRDDVQGYNEDDCRSTEALRDWLESLRAEWEAAGVVVPRPEEKTAEADEEGLEVQQQAEAIRERMLATLPAEAADRRPPDHADVAAGLPGRLAPPRGQRRVVGVLPPEGPARRGPVRRARRRGRAARSWSASTSSSASDSRKPTGSVIDRYSYPLQEIEIGRKGKLKLQTRRRSATSWRTTAWRG